MAIDTKTKRLAIMQVANLVPLTLPEPDGTLDAFDRGHLVFLYTGQTGVVAESSVYYSILEAVQTGVRSIGLDDIPDANVQIYKVLNERETVQPGIPGVIIAPLGSETIQATAGTNASDDIGYPVVIVLLDQERQQSRTGLPADALEGTQDQFYRFEEKLLWREKVRRQFINQRLALSGVTAKVNRCTVEPMDVVDEPSWRENIWWSAMVFRFWTREARGN